MSATTRRMLLLGLLIAVGAVGAWLVLQAADPVGDALHGVQGGALAEEGTDAHLAGRAGEADTGAADTEGVPSSDALDGNSQVRGFVRDEAGEGLAGIRVELTGERKTPWRSHRDRFLAGPIAAPVLAVTTTGDDGSFAFQGARYAEQYQLTALPAPPRYPVERWAHTLPAYQVRPLVLVVGQGSPLRLRVVDAEGRGRVAHLSAVLHATYVEDGRVHRLYWTRSLGATDAEGRLAVASVPAGRLKVSVDAPGFGFRSGFVVDVPAEEEVVLRFEETEEASVAGRVHDDEGRPIADAWVHAAVRRIAGRGIGVRDEYASRGVATDAGGTFRIGGLPAWTLEDFVVEARGFVERTDAVPAVPLDAGETLRVDVRMRRGCVLEGVVRGPDGEPIAGARVSAMSAPTTGRFFTSRTAITADGTTDTRGRYRLEGLPVLSGTVEAEVEGLYTVCEEGGEEGGEEGRPGGRPFALPEPGDVRRVDLVLARGVRVVGHVVDEEGRPVPRVEVQARCPSVFRRLPAWVADDEARFVYEGLAPGQTWTFHASTGRGWTEPVSLRLEPGDAEAAVALIWHEGAVIRGTVLYDGPPSPFPGRVRCRSAARQGGGFGFNRARSVAEDGTFHLEGVPPGAHELSVVDYNLDQNGQTVRVEVASGQLVEGAVLHARRMGEVAGVVVDEEGQPVSGAWVHLQPLEEGWSGTKRETSDEEGRFHFPCVPDVDYDLRLDDGAQPGYIAQPGNVEQPGDVAQPRVVHVGDVELRLVQPRREEIVLEGTVRGPNGEHVPRATVRIDQSEARGAPRTDFAHVLDGRFRKALERRGERIDLKIDRARDAEGRSLGARPFEVDDVDPNGPPLEIRLDEGLEIRGRIVGPAAGTMGTFVLGAQPVDASGSPIHAARTREVEVGNDGILRIDGLAPGRYRIEDEASERSGWVPGPPVVAEAGDRDVVFRYDAATRVAGIVRDAGGRPVAKAWIHYAWARKAGGGGARSATSGPDGRFTVPSVPSGVLGTLTVRPELELERPLLPATLAEVVAGARNADVALARGALLRGTVTDGTGEAAGRSTLVATSLRDVPGPPSTGYASVVEDEGHFVLGPLPPGRYALRVSPAPGWTFGDDVVVEAPAEDVRLVVTRAER